MPYRNVKERLEEFYRHYAPEKLETAELALSAYEGREEAMFRALEKKYGPESAVPGYCAEENSEDNSTTQHACDHEVVKKPSRVVPLVPKLDFNTARLRLIRFYEYYAPEKLINVDAALKAYEGKEEAMFRALEKKYGPEPKTPRARSNPEPSPSPPPYPASSSSPDGASRLANTCATMAATATGSEAGEGYDYGQGLAAVGVPQTEIPQIMAQFGGNEQRQRYAAAVVMVLRSLNEETLFDPSTPVISFPTVSYPKDEEDIDSLAFMHVCAYRGLFLAAFDIMMQLRSEESEERLALQRAMEEASREVVYRQFLLREALVYIGPIEQERRELIVDDERLHLQGLEMWFRHRRDELLALQVEPPELLDVELRLQRFRETMEAAAASEEHRRRHRTAAVANARRWESMSEASPAAQRLASRSPQAASPPRRHPAPLEHPSWRPAGSSSTTIASSRTPSRQASASVATNASLAAATPGGAAAAPRRAANHRTASPHVSHRSTSCATTSAKSAAVRLSEMERRLRRDPLSSKFASRVAPRGAFSSLKYSHSAATAGHAGGPLLPPSRSVSAAALR